VAADKDNCFLSSLQAEDEGQDDSKKAKKETPPPHPADERDVVESRINEAEKSSMPEGFKREHPVEKRGCKQSSISFLYGLRVCVPVPACSRALTLECMLELQAGQFAP
jgi:hypothetical protein